MPGSKEAKRKNVIEAYISAYNRLDVNAMIETLCEDIIFTNVQDQKETLSIVGKSVFLQQAEKVKQLFKWREMKALKWSYDNDTVRVNIHFEGLLHDHQQNGNIKIKGKSLFQFEGDKIKRIVDEH